MKPQYLPSTNLYAVRGLKDLISTKANFRLYDAPEAEDLVNWLHVMEEKFIEEHKIENPRPKGTAWYWAGGSLIEFPQVFTDLADALDVHGESLCYLVDDAPNSITTY